MLVGGEPVKNGAGSGERGARGLGIGAVEPVVVDHADPEQGKGGNVLRQRTGIAAVGNSVGDAGLVEGFDGLAGEAVVAGYGVGDEGLDAGVAYILELLVVGRVHVGFVGIEAGGAPTDLPDFLRGRGRGTGRWRSSLKG